MPPITVIRVVRVRPPDAGQDRRRAVRDRLARAQRSGARGRQRVDRRLGGRTGCTTALGVGSGSETHRWGSARQRPDRGGMSADDRVPDCVAAASRMLGVTRLRRRRWSARRVSDGDRRPCGSDPPGPGRGEDWLVDLVYSAVPASWLGRAEVGLDDVRRRTSATAPPRFRASASHGWSLPRASDHAFRRWAARARRRVTTARGSSPRIRSCDSITKPVLRSGRPRLECP
jgi:hypothetical protein